jgi:hypothetical protein
MLAEERKRSRPQADAESDWNAKDATSESYDCLEAKVVSFMELAALGKLCFRDFPDRVLRKLMRLP